MPNWHDILFEINRLGSSYDVLRRKYIGKLHEITGRNIIAYYSGWLQKRNAEETIVNDSDKNGLMTVINGLDVDKGLDLILHTPGGDTAATESIVDYLYKKFGNDIRCFVPQMAMSAGTMIACSCKEIWMGKQSSLGPIDPQFGPFPAHAVLEEFGRAVREITDNPALIPVWQPIIAKYNPTLLGECEKAINWSNEIVKAWLIRNMLSDKTNNESIADRIIEELGNHSVNLSHNRHLSAEKCAQIGLTICNLESDQALQDAVLSVHHIFYHTLGATAAVKIIENHKGIAFIQQLQMVLMPQQIGVNQQLEAHPQPLQIPQVSQAPGDSKPNPKNRAKKIGSRPLTKSSKEKGKTD
jgi:hypothetical protein